jgi:peptidyl-prolyl cis-trans isomerase A (cyclophilin A)
MKIGPLFGLVVVMTVAAAAMVSADESAGENDFEINPEWTTGHYARIETPMGRIVARLLPEQAPQSVAHFAAMAEGKLAWADPVSGDEKQFRYYDGIPIHNVRAGLLIEMGDWTGTGKGAPPLYVPMEGQGPVNFSQGGRLGMARPNFSYSAVQFFATASGNWRLNGSFPCFGIIVEGTEVIWELSQTKSYRNGRPIVMPRIESIRIFKVGDPLPLPEPRQVPQPKLIAPKMRDDLYDQPKKP